jgi:hypothetical protein
MITDSNGRAKIQFPSSLGCRRAGTTAGKGTYWATPPTCGEPFSRHPEESAARLAQSKGVLGKILQSGVGPRQLNDALTSGLQNATAYVLREAKAIATANLDQEVKGAVVAVPAYLNDAQRASFLRRLTSTNNEADHTV